MVDAGAHHTDKGADRLPDPSLFPDPLLPRPSTSCMVRRLCVTPKTAERANPRRGSKMPSGSWRSFVVSFPGGPARGAVAGLCPGDGDAPEDRPRPRGTYRCEGGVGPRPSPPRPRGRSGRWSGDRPVGGTTTHPLPAGPFVPASAEGGPSSILRHVAGTARNRRVLLRGPPAGPRWGPDDGCAPLTARDLPRQPTVPRQT